MKNIKKRFYVQFLGCEKRKLDAQRIIDFFRKNGYLLAPIKLADIVIFVSCGFCEK